MTRECVQLNNHVQIQRVVKLLGTDFAASHNPNMRKGALVGLAAVAIALGTGVTTNTILQSFFTHDSVLHFLWLRGKVDVLKGRL